MKAPLYEQLYAHILAEIEAGRLHPGSRVPSEKELAAQFHVSRITSKRALEKLAQDGIIVRARGRGSFVRSEDPATPASEAAARAVTDGANLHGPLPLVGFLVPDVSDIYGTHMLRVIEDELRRQGMRMVLCRTQGRREFEEQAIEDCLALDRRRGVWAAGAAAQARPDRLEGIVVGDRAPTLPGMEPLEVTVADLWVTGVSATGHPTEFLRADLDRRGVVTAAGLWDQRPGSKVLVGGVVTHRQRPMTAGGTTFINLEDETGLMNVVVSKGCWTRYATVARNAPALLVHGRLERAEGVINIIAERLSPLTVAATAGSRDFR